MYKLNMNGFKSLKTLFFICKFIIDKLSFNIFSIIFTLENVHFESGMWGEKCLHQIM